MSERLFVYGTLKDPEVQKREIGRVTPGTPDVLQGFTRSQIVINKNTYPIVVQKPGDEVSGLVLDVTPDELKKLDIYETDAYRRSEIVLKSGVPAWVYHK